MANALYDHGREGFLDGSIDWDTDDIKMYLVDEGVDTIDLANDSANSAVTSPVATSGNFGSKDVSAGVADAANVTFSSVTGAQSESLSIFSNTASRLICNIDTATGLPVTPNGGDITVQWDDGANKIFKL